MNLHEATQELEIDNFKLDAIKIDESNLELAFFCYDVEKLVELVVTGKKYFLLESYQAIELECLLSELSKDNEFWFEALQEKMSDLIVEKIEHKIKQMARDLIEEVKSNYNLQG